MSQFWNTTTTFAIWAIAILAITAILAGVFVMANAADTRTDHLTELCITYGRQWIDGNCIALPLG